MRDALFSDGDLAESMLIQNELLTEKLAQKEARIRKLEDALKRIIQTYPIDALGLTVDARMREIAREALSDKAEV